VGDLGPPGVSRVDFAPGRGTQPAPLGDVPAVAMTGFYEDFAPAKAADVSFKAFFRKPVNLERLCSTLAALRRGEPVAGDQDRYD
jgi:hypothetical protein